MKLREPEMPLDPQIERELEAMVAEFEADLGELRPTPSEEFAARLDERAAAGFRDGGRRFEGPAELWERITSVPPRRILTTAGAFALVAVVVATVATVPGGGGSGSDTGDSGGVAPVAVSGSAAGAAEAKSAADAPAPTAAAPSAVTPGTEPSASGSAGVGAAGATRDLSKHAPSNGQFGPGANRRAVERSASITLGTDPEQVRSTSGKVYDIVGRYRGIVLNSSIRDGGDGQAGAEFELLIPSARLSGALADLSGIAEVRSREETAQDITAPTVTVQEHLQDARAEVEGLLKQLAEATTDSKRAGVKVQLHFQRRRVAALRASLSDLQRRADLSRVSLQIVTGDATAFTGSGDSSWTLGDAAHDAGRILAVAAGVILIGLAVLAPIALIALIIWLGRRSWVRSRRERALGEI